jgi:hypothetical protein
MHFVIAVAVYLVALAIVGVAAFFIVIVVAGPHAGLLPQPLEVVVLIAGWLAVLGLPLWVAMKVWRRLQRRRVASTSVR